uniref:C3H1-type domain-containing protein n=1 Tax=Spongospora subterranea TaxID=70186 RepID=A0A0H5QM71_9EUKA|eukprot:CRZ02682.1 hypothetical protein [Spongospora subterranea]
MTEKHQFTDFDDLFQAYEAARSLLDSLLSQVKHRGIKTIYVSSDLAQKAKLSVEEDQVPSKTSKRSPSPTNVPSTNHHRILGRELVHLLKLAPNHEIQLSLLPSLYKRQFGCDIDRTGYSSLSPLIRSAIATDFRISMYPKGTNWYLSAKLSRVVPESTPEPRTKRPKLEATPCIYFNQRVGCKKASTCPFVHVCDQCGSRSHGRVSCATSVRSSLPPAHESANV